MKRSRAFILLFAVAVALAVPAIASAHPVTFTHGVASGDVRPQRAVLWTRVDHAPSFFHNIRVEVRPAATAGPLCAIGPTTYTSPYTAPLLANDFTVKVDTPAGSLAANTRYCYRFRQLLPATFSPVGTFRTAPLPSTSANVHFTYSGDQDGTGTIASPCCGTFDSLLRARQALSPTLADGDFYVANGDNIYADSVHRTIGPAATLPAYWTTYKDVLTFPNLTGLRAATSQYPVMDDREVQNDYAGAGAACPVVCADARRAFLNYMPIRESGLLTDPSCGPPTGDHRPLYRKFRWGSDVDLFVLDERWCRSPDVTSACGGDIVPTLPTAVRTSFPFSLFLTPSPPPGCLTAINDCSRTMLGPVQKLQFKIDLLSSTAKFKYVISEVPIQEYYYLPYDRWEGYACERNHILNFIDFNNITNVDFLSGGCHATMFQNQVGLPSTREFVTGPIGTDTCQDEVVALGGPVGLAVFNLLLNPPLAGVDCRNLNTLSWGEVTYAGGTSTVASRDNTPTAPVVPNQAAPPIPPSCT